MRLLCLLSIQFIVPSEYHGVLKGANRVDYCHRSTNVLIEFPRHEVTSVDGTEIGTGSGGCITKRALSSTLPRLLVLPGL